MMRRLTENLAFGDRVGSHVDSSSGLSGEGSALRGTGNRVRVRHTDKNILIVLAVRKGKS